MPFYFKLLDSSQMENLLGIGGCGCVDRPMARENYFRLNIFIIVKQYYCTTYIVYIQDRITVLITGFHSLFLIYSLIENEPICGFLTEFSIQLGTWQILYILLFCARILFTKSFVPDHDPIIKSTLVGFPIFFYFRSDQKKNKNQRP